MNISNTSIGPILSVTAFTEVFPDSQKVAAVIVEYDRDIDNARLAKNAFAVTDKFESPVYPLQAIPVNGGVVESARTVTRIYANTVPEKVEQGTNGRYVIIELSPDDEAAPTLYLVGEHRDCRAHMKKIKLAVTQKADIAAADGGVCAAPAVPVYSGKTVNLIADEFHKGEFEGLKYNLFIPKNYDECKSYPLVHFIVDGWGVGPDHEITLAQGLGGVVWAFPEEQAKHECFVLAPQFPGPTIVEDDYSASEELETAKRLLDYITSQYSIDRQRIYHTGQSMGFLSGCELNIRYPDLFAASLMVAGFWNPETMVALKDKNIWFFDTEGDKRAHEVLSIAIGNMEAAGAKVGRCDLDGKAGKDTLNEAISAAACDGNNIKYTVFVKDSTVPDDVKPNTASNHRGTWHLVYGLESVRDWLFGNRNG